ncbi:uncharacterized protein LOC144194321 [Stigmatopora nigra]
MKTKIKNKTKPAPPNSWLKAAESIGGLALACKGNKREGPSASLRGNGLRACAMWREDTAWASRSASTAQRLKWQNTQQIDVTAQLLQRCCLSTNGATMHCLDVIGQNLIM